MIIIGKLSLRQQVFTYLKNNPNADNERLREQFSDSNWNSVRTYKSQFFNKIQDEVNQKKSDNSIIVRDISEEDDKSLLELLTMATKQGLMQKNPDPRWGSLAFRLLDTTEQLQKYNEGEEEEWLDKAKDMELPQVVDDMLGNPTKRDFSAKELSEETT